MFYILFLLHTIIFITVTGLEEASPGQFPYTVSLQIAGLGGHNCAGAILDQWWVLTTASCADIDDSLDHDHFLVVAGEYDLVAGDGTEQVRHVERVVRHPYFSTEGCDIALIRLNVSLDFDEFVSPISLADMGEEFSGDCSESGWSQLGHHLTMQYAQPAILNTEECRGNPSAGQLGYGAICAGHDGTGTAEMCPGYNGSPLACVRQDTNTTVLAGLQMFTYSCMEQGAPSVYTEVAALRDWADYVMGKIVI